MKGFTKLQPSDPRGPARHLRRASPRSAAIEYLVALGVTAVELLPVHHIADEQHLVDKGLTNYWGYSSIGYPRAARALRGDRHARRAGARVQGDGQGAAPRRDRGDPRRRLQPHRRGQPPRPDALVPRRSTTRRTTGSLPDDPRFYMDYTGTGNSLNPVHPSVLRLIMDSLRYFVVECHVDGFRFDLASALAREFHEVDRLSAFFDIIHQDPVLSQVKLIAEPWDVGEGGYQVGNFPVLWTEWNGSTATRCATSGAGRRPSATSPTASPARPTSTSATAAGRSRRSTSSPRTTASRSPTSSRTTRSTTRRTSRTTATAPTTTAAGTAASRGRPTIPRSIALRERQQRNFLATLFLSQGVPMLLGGDETRPHAARQQQRVLPGQRDLVVSTGTSSDATTALLEFTRRLIALRRDAPGLPARRRSSPASPTSGGLPDVWWFRPDGRRMTRRDWDGPGGPALGVFLNGDEIRAR